MSVFTKFLDFMGYKKKVVHIQLDPDQIRESNTIKALANENAELKGFTARLQAEIGQFRESQEDVNEEENVKRELKKQKLQIDKEYKGKYLSLKRFFAKYHRDKKFREKLMITTFDRGTNLARFGDFGLTDDGRYLILDENGNEVLKLNSLQDMFQSVAGLGNDIKSFKIPINLDKNHSWIENPMVYEYPEYIREDDGKIRYTKAKKRVFYELIAEKNEEIGRLHSELEETESVITKMQIKMDDMERGLRMNENSAETARSELSKAEQRQSAVERNFRETEKDFLRTKQINIINEDNLTKLETQLGLMREEAIRQGVKLPDDRAMEMIKNIRRELVRDEPKREVRVVQQSSDSSQNQA